MRGGGCRRQRAGQVGAGPARPASLHWLSPAAARRGACQAPRRCSCSRRPPHQEHQPQAFSKLGTTPPHLGHLLLQALLLRQPVQRALALARHRLAVALLQVRARRLVQGRQEALRAAGRGGAGDEGVGSRAAVEQAGGRACRAGLAGAQQQCCMQTRHSCSGPSHTPQHTSRPPARAPGTRCAGCRRRRAARRRWRRAPPRGRPAPAPPPAWPGTRSWSPPRPPRTASSVGVGRQCGGCAARGQGAGRAGPGARSAGQPCRQPRQLAWLERQHSRRSRHPPPWPPASPAAWPWAPRGCRATAGRTACGWAGVKGCLVTRRMSRRWDSCAARAAACLAGRRCRAPSSPRAAGRTEAAGRQAAVRPSLPLTCCAGRRCTPPARSWRRWSRSGCGPAREGRAGQGRAGQAGRRVEAGQ